MVLFQKGRLIVRELEEKDQHLLVKWLSDPIVLEFYEGRDNPFDLEKVKAQFYNDERNVTRCMIEFDGVEIGYAQYYLLNEKDREHYGYTGDDSVIFGTDQLIGEVDYWNKGIGKVLVKSIVEYLAKEKQADKVVMNPQSWNERAIRCYEKCGFKKVKLLPKHVWHEGTYQDCWIVEYRN